MEYICLDCGVEFDEPVKYVEKHGLDSPPYEEYYGCPACGGAFEEKKEIESEDEDECE